MNELTVDQITDHVRNELKKESEYCDIYESEGDRRYLDIHMAKAATLRELLCWLLEFQEI